MIDDANMALESPASDVFEPPSINHDALQSGATYSHFSPVPPSLLEQPSSDNEAASDSSKPAAEGPACCLGVDEAGRGPVLGPMVYAVFYLPLEQSDVLLKDTHHFDDSKVLTPAVRSRLMQTLCTPETDLHTTCGWATAALSARDIGANMLKPTAIYNLNAQAMDATVDLIKGVLARGVNVREIFIDTIGQPAAYQAKLERVFPTINITVAKKADSLYPCVSAASVCAKVTRDAALEVLFEARAKTKKRKAADDTKEDDEAEESWGSGYPSDARCSAWLKRNMHPLFGWGSECRFSWSTAKDMLEGKAGVKVEWPLDEEEEISRVTDFFVDSTKEKDVDELSTWFGTPAGVEAF